MFCCCKLGSKDLGAVAFQALFLTTCLDEHPHVLLVWLEILPHFDWCQASDFRALDKACVKVNMAISKFTTSM